MLKVQLGGSLASVLEGDGADKREFDIEGRNVADVVARLRELHPELGPVLDRGFSVSIDGTLHRNALYKPLSPDNEIFLLPRIVGG